MKRLLDDTPESAYWVGFLLADGGFSDRRLKLTLAAKDKTHLQAFATFTEISTPLGYSERANAFTTTRQDPELIGQICRRFDIKPRKTYNPPSFLPYADKDLLTAALVGFIDGDGSITLQSGRRSVVCRTVSHLSWFDLLQQWSDATSFGRVTVRKANSQQYAQLASHQHVEVANLRRFVISLGLPVLKRKWDRVDLDLDVRGQLQYAVVDGINKGLTNKEILSLTGCSPAYLSVLRKRGG